MNKYFINYLEHSALTFKVLWSEMALLIPLIK